MLLDMGAEWDKDTAVRDRDTDAAEGRVTAEDAAGGNKKYSSSCRSVDNLKT